MMGGVPVLVVMALAGITYGWQPDRAGGVEYIIQISPAELEAAKQRGVTSAIDPRIRGHVSRIRVVVGNSSLPRQTPTELADHAPIARPQLDHTAASDHRSRTPQQTNWVMKPGDPASGPGFSLPNLPPTVRDAGARTLQGIDRAGRDVAERSAAALNNLRSGNRGTVGGSTRDRGYNRVPPPSTRNLQQVNPNANESGASRGFQRTDPRRPSTSPAARRDDTWTNFPQRSTQGDGRTNAAAALDERADRRLTHTDGRGSLPNQRESALRDSNFGKMPSSLTVPQREFARDNRGSGSGNIYSQREQFEFDRRNQSMSPLGGVTIQTRRSNDDQYRSPARDRWATDAYRDATGNDTGGQSPYSDFAEDRARTTRRGDQDLAYPDVNRASIRAPEPYGSDPLGQQRGTRWAEDSTDRPSRPQLPRTGPQERLGIGTSPGSVNPRFARYDERSPEPRSRYADPRARPAPYPDRDQVIASDATARRDQSGRRPAENPMLRDPRPASEQAAYRDRVAADDQRRERYMTERNEDLRRDRVHKQSPQPDLSRVDRQPPQSETNSVATRNAKHVAAQPLFNGLLLISFVANIYLIFWLKNLRLRFHDLVSAKRVANSSSTATPA